MSTQTPRIEEKYPGDNYSSPERAISFLASRFPTPYFYARMLAQPVRRLCSLAAAGACDDAVWVAGSNSLADILEATGARIEISGMSFMDAAGGPCVFVANHMSTLETFLLPGIIRPRMPVTFVVKDSLVKMPFFGPVMRSRDPVVVNRKNPREDLLTVLNEGTQRLAKGISVVVFPQSTRSLHFEAAHFNTIGVKLALKAGVPVIPLALKSDAWGQGKKIKEAGKIRPDLPVRFKFFPPVRIEGNGKSEHGLIRQFIGDTLSAWQAKDGINL